MGEHVIVWKCHPWWSWVLCNQSEGDSMASASVLTLLELLS